MEKIKQLIAAGQTDEAIRQLDAYIIAILDFYNKDMYNQ